MCVAIDMLILQPKDEGLPVTAYYMKEVVREVIFGDSHACTTSDETCALVLKPLQQST